MKQVKLWKISDKKVPEPIKNINETETELLLENLIIEYPSMIEKDLSLIGRQTETGTGPLDLLGIDCNGELVVIELKKGMLHREVVAQIIDYASALSEMELNELFEHIENQSGIRGIEKIDSFEEWYTNNFSTNFDNLLKSPRLLLVGIGADTKTKRMVSFLSEMGINISLITFFAYQENDQLYFARQVEIEAEKEMKQIQKTQNNIKNNTIHLETLADSLNVKSEIYKLSEIITQNIPKIYRYPNKQAFSFSLPDKTDEGKPTNRCFLNLYIQPNKKNEIQIFIRNRAVSLIENEFIEFSKEFGIRKHKDEGYFKWIKVNDSNENFYSKLDKIMKLINERWSI